MKNEKKVFSGLAEDLKVGDLFRHNELRNWEVINVEPKGHITIKVTARYTGGSSRIKIFDFGNRVSL